jgi:hypothetical protein
MKNLKLTWLEKKQKEPAMPDLRKDARIIPANPHSTLTMADGATHGCFVVDMSASGVAVSEFQVRIGKASISRTFVSSGCGRDLSSPANCR